MILCKIYCFQIAVFFLHYAPGKFGYSAVSNDTLMELPQELTLFQRVVITGLDILYNGLFADCQEAIQHHQNILYIKYLWNQGTNKLYFANVHFC